MTVAKAKDRFNWQPSFDLEQGMARYVDSLHRQ